MEILTLLHHRRSSKKFGSRAPDAQQLENILKAALRAPDHGRLKPYRFVIIDQAAQTRFKQHLLAAAAELNLNEEAFKKAENLSQRAPLVIGVVAKLDDSIAKVPEWEQLLTAGCATYAMQLAANAQGFDTCWITGKWVEGSALRAAFGCQAQDKIVALLMIGAPENDEAVTLARESEEIAPFVMPLN